MRGAIHSLPQYAFMTWCLVKAQRQLYFLLFEYYTFCSNFEVIHSQEIFIPKSLSYFLCHLAEKQPYFSTRPKWLSENMRIVTWDVELKQLVWPPLYFILSLLLWTPITPDTIFFTCHSYFFAGEWLFLSLTLSSAANVASCVCVCVCV
jgi:hypothetical protein